MPAKDLTLNDLFEFHGKLWEVIGFSTKSIRVRSENEEIASLPKNSEVIVKTM